MASTGLSESSIRKHLRQLKDLGFITGRAGNYQLRSYDYVWDMLGIERRKKDSSRFKKRLFRVRSHAFIEETQAYEIQFELNAQSKRLIEKHSISRASVKDTDSVTENSLNRYINIFKREISNSKHSFKKWQIAKLRKTLDYPLINYDVTLTCEAVARLFGYSSFYEGQKIEHRLENLGLLSIQRQSPIFLCNNNAQAASISPIVAASCIESPCGNYIYKFMPNLLTVNIL